MGPTVTNKVLSKTRSYGLIQLGIQLILFNNKIVFERKFVPSNTSTICLLSISRFCYD